MKRTAIHNPGKRSFLLAIVQWFICWHRLDLVIDLDGTIFNEGGYPGIGPYLFGAKWALKHWRGRHCLILSTCREGDLLGVAVYKLGLEGIRFDYLNENTRERREQWKFAFPPGKTDCRKITGDYGIDNLYRPIFWPWEAVKVWFMERGPSK